MRHLITAGLYLAAIVHALALRAWPHFWAWFVGQPTEQETEQVVSTPVPVDQAALAVDYASLLEALSVKDLRKTCVTLGLPSKAYRAARKADLVALLADLHVDPTL